LERNGRTRDWRRVGVAGSGTVAIYSIEQAQRLGATVIACSDSSGYVVDDKGIDLDLLKQVKEVERERISVYAERRGNASHYVEGGSIWDVPCEVAIGRASCRESVQMRGGGGGRKPTGGAEEGIEERAGNRTRHNGRHEVNG